MADNDEPLDSLSEVMAKAVQAAAAAPSEASTNAFYANADGGQRAQRGGLLEVFGGGETATAPPAAPPAANIFDYAFGGFRGAKPKPAAPQEEEEEEEDGHSVVSVDDQNPAGVVPQALVVKDRTLSVRGAPGPGDPAEFARALFGGDYAAPRGVHVAEYVSVRVVLSEERPVWMPNKQSLGGRKGFLQACLRGAVAQQPSVKTSPDGGDGLVFVDGAGRGEPFDLSNAVVLGFFLERAAAEGADVGVRVGMYLQPNATNPDVSFDESPDPPAARVAAALERSPACAHDAATGAAYSFLAYRGAAAAFSPPRRLGAPLFHAWDRVFDEHSDATREDGFWDDDTLAFLGEDSVDVELLRSAAPTSELKVDRYFAADAALITYRVVRPGTKTHEIFAPSLSALRQAFLRLKFLERKSRCANDQDEVAAEAFRAFEALRNVPDSRSVWLVAPANADVVTQWRNKTRHPRVGDDHRLGVRTLTRDELALVGEMRVRVRSRHPAVRLLQKAGLGMEVPFTTLVRVVNEHLHAVERAQGKQQMRDVARVGVVAAPLGGAEAFRVELTLGLVVAPLTIARGPETGAPEESSVSHFPGARTYTMQAGSRTVIPLAQPNAYVRPMAYDRAAGENVAGG